MMDMGKENPGPLLLLAEEDGAAATPIAEYLCREGFRVRLEHQLQRVVFRVQEEAPDLVVLAMSPSGQDVFSVCRQLRAGFSGPLVLLTAGSDEAGEILGLESGADDCLAKPIRFGALLARIRARLRTHSGEPAVTDICVGGLQLSMKRRSAVIDGCQVPLTKGEFDLLWYLAQHVNTVVSRSELYDSLLGIHYDGVDRSLDLRVSRLRRKLGGDARKLVQIRSIRAVGYMLVVA